MTAFSHKITKPLGIGIANTNPFCSKCGKQTAWITDMEDKITCYKCLPLDKIN